MGTHGRYIDKDSREMKKSRVSGILLLCAGDDWCE